MSSDLHARAHEFRRKLLKLHRQGKCHVVERWLFSVENIIADVPVLLDGSGFIKRIDENEPWGPENVRNTAQKPKPGQ